MALKKRKSNPPSEYDFPAKLLYGLIACFEFESSWFVLYFLSALQNCWAYFLLLLLIFVNVQSNEIAKSGFPGKNMHIL